MTYEAPIGHVNDHDFYPTYIFDIDISVVFLPSLVLMISVYLVVSKRRLSLPSRASANTRTRKNDIVKRTECRKRKHACDNIATGKLTIVSIDETMKVALIMTCCWSHVGRMTPAEWM